MLKKLLLAFIFMIPLYADIVKDYTDQCFKGDSKKCLKLAWMYEDGDKVCKSQPTAISFYKKACSGGTMNACHSLGWIYEKADGVSQDIKKAKKYYEKACNAGFIGSCNMLKKLDS